MNPVTRDILFIAMAKVLCVIGEEAKGSFDKESQGRINGMLKDLHDLSLAAESQEQENINNAGIAQR